MSLLRTLPFVNPEQSLIGKILIVDDESELTSILVEALTAQNYEVRGFTSGIDALEYLRSADTDILLSDLMMPGLSGLELFNAALEIDPNLMCVIMTGHATVETAVETMKRGAFDYVLKPFRIQTIMPILARAMNARRLRLENVQLREAIAIHELSQTIALSLDPGTILSKLADAALDQTQGDEVSVLLPTADGKELYVAASRGENRQHLLGERIPFDKSIAGWVGHHLEPLILNGEVNDPRFVSLWPRSEIQSSASVPMQSANRMLGVLNINKIHRQRKFTLGEIKALTILANTAAAGLENASLHEKVRKAEKNYRMIFENAIEGIFQSTPDHRFLTVNPSLARILGYDSPEELIEAIPDAGKQLYVCPEVADEVTRRLETECTVKGLEFEAYRKNGEKIWLSLNIRLIEDQGDSRCFREGTIEDITERKRAEDKARTLTAQIEGQRRRLDNIVRSVPGVVWEAWGHPDSATQKINFVSDYVETLLGYSVEEWLSTPNFWLSIVHPEDKESASARARACFERGGSDRAEFRWLTKDGRAIWIDSNFATIRDENGVSAGMRGVNIDITESKAAVQAWIDSERRYRMLFEHNPIPMWVYDRETLRFLEINEAAIQRYGYSREEFQRLTLKDIRPEGDIPLLLEALAKERTSRPFAATMRHRTKDNEIFPVEITGHSLLFGTRPAELVLAKDVTARRERDAMQARRFAHAALRADVTAALADRSSNLKPALDRCVSAVVDHLGAAFARVWTLNEEEQVLELHASAGMYTHIDGDHGRVPMGEFKIGRIAQNREPHITNDVQNDNEISDREWARREGMKSFAGYPLLAEDKVVGVLALFARELLPDDTLDALASISVIVSQAIERKQIEKALERSEEQLRQAQKMEAVGQLAGGVAHDFNNLLTVINGYSDLALRRLAPADPLTHNIEEIRKAGTRAASLTRQLLAFSRKQVLQPQVLDLNALISELEKMLRRLIGEHIDLRSTLQSELGSIKADPGQVEQVLMNLVVNARDAMPKGGKLTIETKNAELDKTYVRSHPHLKPGSYVMLSVSDNGVGIDKETLTRIFEPFFSTKPTGKGTGLGLSTVYGIVTQSNGMISVYSEPGQGTSFHVYLPRVDEPTQEYIRSTPLQEDLRGTETILLVEDEETVRKLVQQVLTLNGYTVIEAENGGTAFLTC